MYLAVVMDMYSRQIVGWAMRPTMTTDLASRTAASSDVFDYIEMFYNPVRRHGFTADLSPVEFERRYAKTGS